uniref:Uncharacterized protein n=1 Tax=Haptolina ericina TaxID=156174 RepID=A0A7S3AZF4_9EUKA|eukprot:CAMPEP_0181235076 /NCGR_PEP_ID=MMETSP1096-20121128/37361_1 /TAXON_ID=156174 ORGANISM="Chrysochromulina ericina, Strain CCMP281" /NCGR_SAMPLE_ID=MMETSP1096 /ASSEMBLY_ACC=CAM_ASM_000453 /LENGTH=104 /DNA_ID=CAMNT_0023329989 /DNA_START=170 /DNA_END=484 /DNA_ORIENTATION=+
MTQTKQLAKPEHQRLPAEVRRAAKHACAASTSPTSRGSETSQLQERLLRNTPKRGRSFAASLPTVRGQAGAGMSRLKQISPSSLTSLSEMPDGPSSPFTITFHV